ncbi:MAG: hypothetical protein HBSAPP03_24140 [Phycisphaerae bacterium]|nr:MAG: hypothetical protein HBSAPP03_24140 [Phycisphaerae bacterium]
MAGSSLDLRDAQAVVAALRAGAQANRGAACRQGSIDAVAAPGRLIATGDLHDNPVHLERLIRLAGMVEGVSPAEHGTTPCHLTLHEIIHGDRLVNGMDFSYRVMTRVAALKARYPAHVHVLLGNHELAQMQKTGIVKDGVKSVEAFSAGLEYVFGEEAPAVAGAVDEFVRSMPLALRLHTPRGDILCAHSLPPAASMGRFDTTILTRDLTDDDYAPRQGAAHLMVWGRGYDAEGLEDLVERWGVYLFILGHEKAPEGVVFVPPNAVVLNSDHEKGVYLPIDLSAPPTPEGAVGLVKHLARD